MPGPDLRRRARVNGLTALAGLPLAVGLVVLGAHVRGHGFDPLLSAPLPLFLVLLLRSPLRPLARLWRPPAGFSLDRENVAFVALPTRSAGVSWALMFPLARLDLVICRSWLPLVARLARQRDDRAIRFEYAQYAVDAGFLADAIVEYVLNPQYRAGIGTAAEHERLQGHRTRAAAARATVGQSPHMDGAVQEGSVAG